MRVLVRYGLPALSAVAILASQVSFAQAPPATKSAQGKADPAAAALLKEPLATVNKDVITRGEVLNFLSRTQLPSGDPEQIYRDAIDSLVNVRLIYQYLQRQRIPVSEAKVDEMIANLEKQLKTQGTSLAQQLDQSQTSMAELRKEYGDLVRWIDFQNTKATDAELQKYFDNHKDLR